MCTSMQEASRVTVVREGTPLPTPHSRVPADFSSWMDGRRRVTQRITSLMAVCAERLHQLTRARTAVDITLNVPCGPMVPGGGGLLSTRVWPLKSEEGENLPRTGGTAPQSSRGSINVERFSGLAGYILPLPPLSQNHALPVKITSLRL